MGFDRYDQDDAAQERHERRITRCTSPLCRKQIIWLRTEAGRNMPVDADTVEPEDEIFESGKHISHWATCSDAGHFRKKKG